MISVEKSESKGIMFYRLMSLIAMLCCVFFGVAFGVFNSEGTAYYWDRALIIAYGGVCLIYSYLPNMNRRVFIRLVYGLFFLFTIQVLWNNYLNTFNFLHLLTLIVTIQAVSFSLRRSEESLVYLIFVNTTAIVLVLNSSIHSIEHISFIIGSLALTSLLMYTIVYLRSKFQRSARVKEEFLRIIVSKTEEAILITDFEGFINETNPTAIEMFKFTASELEGKNFAKLRKNDLTPEEDEVGVKALREDKFWNAEVELVRKNGEAFMAFVSISLIKKYGLELLVYRVRDITPEKQAQIRLEAAKNEAEKAAKVKSAFLATMSHEIRTPMNGVIGMTQLLLNTELNATQSEFVNTIRSCGENLLVIINDILDFSKTEAGKIELEHTQINLKQEIEEVLKLLQSQVNEERVELQLQFSSETPQWVVADSTRLKQIVTNLVGNALKFTQEGSVKIIVDQLDQQGENHLVRFIVEDTGIGIPKEKMAILFESFSQVDSSTTRKFGGTGLGLAICKNLVELMGGELKVESELGKGSSFFFDLWLRGCAEESIIDEQQASLDCILHSGSQISVLVAEDNLVNQRVAELIFKSIGIEVEIAGNGIEVLDMLKQRDFDLIFMDIQMPEMDGLEATKFIPSVIGSNRKMPRIVAMTANAMQEDRAKCLQAGMHDFVVKPIEKDQIINCINRCMLDINRLN